MKCVFNNIENICKVFERICVEFVKNNKIQR
ncbi:hypothetical protein NT01CX_2064 [Clostridium novyi NT]|uniref:Uncharacterized protein n=1 Tax=Clostridium novyi (strain NT) TaxID=386415 RepID=A0Q0I5_CLONN|nr:hypothetical protein NT01CX_2064 [Clostridium novyi NT]